MFRPDFYRRDMQLYADYLRLEEWQRPIVEILLDDYQLSFDLGTKECRDKMSLLKDELQADPENAMKIALRPIREWEAEKKQLKQILIADNAWDNASTAVCSRKTSCNGGSCEQLLGRCDPSPATLSAEWVAVAEQLCAKRGFRLAELRLLGAGERVAALEAAGLAPLERVRVLSALEAG